MKLKEINKYTLQEIFDYVTDKVIQQGEQSIGDDDQCVFISSNGNRCAVGHLLTDDIKFDETDPLSCIIGENELEIDFDKRFLLFHLQQAHDNSSLKGMKGEPFVEHVKYLFEMVADDYGLKCKWND